jgi:hypothetical protein
MIDNQIGTARGSSESPSHHRRKHVSPDAKRRSLALFAALVAVCVLLLVSGCSGKPDASSFEEAFKNDTIATEGVMSSDYVEDSAYEVKEFEASDVNEQNGVYYCSFTATIENDSFKTELEGRGYATPKSENSDDCKYEFTVNSSETSPVAGVSQDPDHDLDDAEITLSKDGETCTATVEDAYDYWFVTGTTTHTYTYSFDSEDGWIFDDEDSTTTTTYKSDLEGTYTSPSGVEIPYTSFTISNVDEDLGSFTISFTQGQWVDGVKNTHFEAKVSEQAGISPEEGPEEDGALDNGIVYYFEATGTSDQGDGSASMNGYIGVDENGHNIIYVESSQVDTLRQLYERDPRETEDSVDDYTFVKE